MNLANVLHLGIKELRGLRREPLLLVLILHAFTLAIYTGAKAMPETLNRAAIAIVDEDRSPVSSRIITSFYPPYFSVPQLISQQEMDTRMDAGTDTFALDIPPDFQRDLLAGRSPTIQLNVDATRMTQAFTGGGYVQSIVTGEVNEFLQHTRSTAAPPVDLDLRARFNPHLSKSWFGAITEVISSVTMLSIILTGAALIREREHGTVEHLLVMPVTPAEIMLSKIWSMGLVVLVASALSLVLVVQGLLAVPIRGSLALFILGAALDLFAMTSLASSWRRSPVPCRSSGCFWCWCCCRCRCFSAASPRARACPRSSSTSCWPRPTRTSSCCRKPCCSEGRGWTWSGRSLRRCWRSGRGCSPSPCGASVHSSNERIARSRRAPGRSFRGAFADGFVGASIAAWTRHSATVSRPRF